MSVCPVQIVLFGRTMPAAAGNSVKIRPCGRGPSKALTLMGTGERRTADMNTGKRRTADMASENADPHTWTRGSTPSMSSAKAAQQTWIRKNAEPRTWIRENAEPLTWTSDTVQNFRKQPYLLPRNKQRRRRCKKHRRRLFLSDCCQTVPVGEPPPRARRFLTPYER